MKEITYSVYCDRCGKVVSETKEDNFKISHALVLNYDAPDCDTNGAAYTHYDLCSKCMRRLSDFLNKRKIDYSDIYGEE